MAIPANGETDDLLFLRDKRGQVAQLVEQRTENPRVGGSIPSLATISITRSSPPNKSTSPVTSNTRPVGVSFGVSCSF
jgi:hypothetical protein